MEGAKNLVTPRGFREFKPEPVPREDVERIKDLCAQTPREQWTELWPDVTEILTKAGLRVSVPSSHNKHEIRLVKQSLTNTPPIARSFSIDEALDFLVKIPHEKPIVDEALAHPTHESIEGAIDDARRRVGSVWQKPLPGSPKVSDTPQREKAPVQHVREPRPFSDFALRELEWKVEYNEDGTEKESDIAYILRIAKEPIGEHAEWPERLTQILEHAGLTVKNTKPDSEQKLISQLKNNELIGRSVTQAEAVALLREWLSISSKKINQDRQTKLRTEILQKTESKVEQKHEMRDAEAAEMPTLSTKLRDLLDAHSFDITYLSERGIKKQALIVESFLYQAFTEVEIPTSPDKPYRFVQESADGTRVRYTLERAESVVFLKNLFALSKETKETKSASKPRAEYTPAQEKHFESEKLVFIAFDTRFESEFGISYDEMCKIEHFQKLRSQQQKVLFENLTECTIGATPEEVQYLVADPQGTRSQKAIQTMQNLLGAVSASFKSAFEKQSTKSETPLERATPKGETGFHNAGRKRLLEYLVSNIYTHGTRAHSSHEGRLWIDLVDIVPHRDNRQPEREAIAEVNKSARTLSGLPHAWKRDEDGEKTGIFGKLKTAVRQRFTMKGKNEMRYTNATRAYERAQEKLVTELRNWGRTDTEIAEMLIGTDERLMALQTVRTDDEALQMFALPENRMHIQEATNALMQPEGLKKLSLGTLGRTVLGELPARFGAPLVEAGTKRLDDWKRDFERTSTMAIPGHEQEEMSTIVKYADVVDEIRGYQTKLKENTNQSRLARSQLENALEKMFRRMYYGSIDYGIGAQGSIARAECAKIFGEALVLLERDAGVMSDKTDMPEAVIRAAGLALARELVVRQTSKNI